MDTSVLRAERTLSLLTSTYLANTDAVKSNLAVVVDAVLSQNLFVYIGQSGIKVETAKKYENAVNKWLARINSLTVGKTSESRVAGVVLMKHTALQSSSLLLENAAKWTTNVLNIIGKAEITPVYKAALQTLLVFMDIVREVPTLYREIASTQVPRMNQAILALTDKNPDLVDAVLEMLMFSASWFPTLFRPSIDKTEALCLRLLDGSMAKSYAGTCSLAAQCLSSLSVVGGKMTIEERWFQYTQLALGTIELCVDHVMCKSSTELEAQSSVHHFEFPRFADDFVISIPQAVDRIASMTDLIIALLSRPIDVDIPIPADALVSAASKLALISLRVASAKSGRAEYDLVPMLSPEIQRSSIRILAALSIALGNCMLPFLSSVARIVAIINTRHISSASTTVAMHALVQLYVQRYGYNFVVFLPKDFLESTIQDINVQSKRQASAATATSQASALSTHGSKKRSGNGKARAAESADVASEDMQTAVILWTDVVHAGLKTILAILRHTPTIVSSSTRTKIDGQILTLLMIDMVGGMETSFSSRQSESPCKIALYECLQASVLSPDPWHKAILPHSLTVFSAGLSDPSPRIRNICLNAISAIEPIIHSRLPAQLRAPDTEEKYESEMVVSNSVFNDEKTINKALNGMVIAESVTEPDLLNAKRYKQSSPIDPSSHMPSVAENSYQARGASLAMPTNTVPISSVSSTGSTSVLVESSAVSVKVESQDVSFASLAAQPIQPAVTQSASFSATADVTAVAKPSAAVVNETDGYNEEIPDIVMEGSDSEDED
ncbi:hypothetical protein FB645_005347 [Coemansia sp. IMI 203386]|nr:hypothetical protein FB645_005347 [Coemansia sp. IMI 203386]